MAESARHYGHQSAAIAWKTVLVVGALLAAMVLLIVVGNYVALRTWLAPDHAAVMARRGAVPPEPRLQARPRGDLAAFRASNRLRLSSYGWTDASHQYAHIPITRAMALYAQQQAKRAAAPASATSQGARP